VGPTLYRYLGRLGIPVELYAPHGTPANQLELGFLEQGAPQGVWVSQDRVSEGALALVEVIDRIARDPYQWPFGRVAFQKLAYFGTELGLPTGLSFARSSYGPYSADLSKTLTQLVNNGLIEERRVGRMFAIEPGMTFHDARHNYRARLERWELQIDRLVDLFARIRTTEQAEMAATVHFVTKELTGERVPTENAVVKRVLEWKPRWSSKRVASAVRYLGHLGWLNTKASKLALAETAVPA
jgi:uncharacterized protein YwgA